MSLLPRELASQFFPDLVEELQEATDLRNVWEMMDYNFPYIALHVFHEDGGVLIGLLLDAVDWPHRPFSAIPAAPNFRKRLPVKKVPRAKDNAGEVHVYNDPKAPGTGAYFCVEGTREYHEDHGDIVPWEWVRHLPQYKAVAVVNNCVDLVDRSVPRPGADGGSADEAN